MCANTATPKLYSCASEAYINRMYVGDWRSRYFDSFELFRLTNNQNMRFGIGCKKVVPVSGPLWSAR